jgi:hypothetical protein
MSVASREKHNRDQGKDYRESLAYPASIRYHQSCKLMAEEVRPHSALVKVQMVPGWMSSHV